MATKSVSTFAIYFIFFLVMFEVPEIKAQGNKCLKEYGGNVGFSYCAPKIFPTFCYQNCRKNKGAKGGRCLWGEAVAGGVSVKCLCDFCSDKP
ncbi:Defensin-like protein [Cardamine amara subsp. amara]|uniref:Defensin-like protein n=1 Tax=Cardamine amara subsp. amara TaxID=228776 RepID=A0ABD0ZUU1_CARAN